MNQSNKLFNKLCLLSKFNKNNVYPYGKQIDFTNLNLTDIMYLPFVYPGKSNEKYRRLRDDFIYCFYKKNLINNDIKYCNNNLYYCILISILDKCDAIQCEIEKEEEKPSFKITPIYNEKKLEDLFIENIYNSNNNIFFEMELQENDEFYKNFNVNTLIQENYIQNCIDENYKEVFNNNIDDNDFFALKIHFSTLHYMLNYHYLKLINVFEFVNQQEETLTKTKPTYYQTNLNFLLNNAYHNLSKKRERVDDSRERNKKKRKRRMNINNDYDDDDNDIILYSDNG